MSRFAEAVCRTEDDEASAPKVFGLVLAKISKRLDDGTYELIYDSRGSGEPSAPARVAMPMAGGGRGLYMMPEQGDEVLVGFEQGEPNLPIVMGALWNAKAPAPDVARAGESSNDVRTVVSRSGHQVTLDDTPGKERVVVRTQGAHELVLDDSVGGPKITLRSAGGLTIQFDDLTKSITVSAPNAITLSTTSLTLSGTGGIALQSNGLLTIDGTPFLAHIHAPPATPAGTTGPVKP